MDGKYVETLTLIPGHVVCLKKVLLFLWEWDNRAKTHIIKSRIWPMQENSVPGESVSEINC